MNEREFFEEVIQTYNVREEEIERLFISESLNELERVTFIIKRGCNLQRSVLIDNVGIYLDRKEVMECIIYHLLEYLEIWDDSLQIDFARALRKIFSNRINKDLISLNFGSVINPVLRLCIKLITTYDKKISDEFLFAFDSIINFYTQENIKVDIQNDLIELVTTMGSFGKSTQSRRFSVYFCSSFLQITNTYSHSELSKRFILLSSDSEKIIRQEISHRIKFLCFDEMFIRSNIFKIIENFISDNDIIIKSEAIHSFLKISSTVPDHDLLFLVCKTFYSITSEIKTIDKTYYKFLIKIFREMVRVYHLSPTIQTGQVHLQFVNTVKHFLTNFTLNLYNNGEYTNINYLIEDFDKIVNVINEKKTSNSLVVNLFKLIVQACFETGSKESPSVTTDSFKNEGNFRDTISSTTSSIKPTTESYQTLFFANINQILTSIDLEIQNKLLMHHFFSHFESTEGKIHFGHIVIYFKNLLPLEEKLNNVDFFLSFYSLMGKFQEYILDVNIDWRIGVSYIKSLRRVEFIYKINEESTSEIFIFVQKCIRFTNLQIQRQAMKLMARLLKFSKEIQREEILKFLDKDILNSESFFTKRLYLSCVEEMVKIFSYNFLKEHQVIENILTFFNYADNIKFSVFTCKLLEYLHLIFPHLEDDSKMKFIIFNNLESIRRNNKDLELSRSMTKFDTWYDLYIKNKKTIVEEFYHLEKKKVKEEAKFFAREINYFKSTGKSEEKRSILNTKQPKRVYKSYQNVNSSNLKPIVTGRAGSKKSSLKEKEKDYNITITKQSNSLEKSYSYNDDDKYVRYTNRKISDVKEKLGAVNLNKAINNNHSTSSKSKYGSITTSPITATNNSSQASVSILNLNKNNNGSPKIAKRNMKINPHK